MLLEPLFEKVTACKTTNEVFSSVASLVLADFTAKLTFDGQVTKKLSFQHSLVHLLSSVVLHYDMYIHKILNRSSHKTPVGS